MQFKNCLLPLAAATLLLTACGGSSSTSPATSGIAVDGYLVGATVSCNIDGTGFPSAANTNADAVTDINGRYTFSQGCAKGVIVIGGLNKDTGKPFRGILRAPAGATVVSPLSTLIVANMAAGMTATLAQDTINLSLGLPANTDLLNTDPAAPLSGTTFVNPSLLKRNLLVQQLIQTATQNIAALVPSSTSDTKTIYSQVAAALANQTANNLTPLVSANAVNPVVVTPFISTAVSNVIASPTTPTEIAAALTPTGAASTLANVTGAAVTSLAQTFLAAADTSAALLVVTANTQSDTRIATFIATQQPTPLTTLTAAAVNAAVNIPSPTAPIDPVLVVTTTTTTTAAPTTTTTAAPTTTTTAVSTTSTTTTTTSTTTTTLSPNNYLALAGDAISFDNGSAATSFTFTQFQTGAGIPVVWPLANTAAIKFSLADGGAFSVAAGETFSAALSVTDTASTAQVSAYVDGVSISKNGSTITVSVPSTATGRVYFKSTDGKEALCTWITCGSGSATTTLSTATGTTSSLVLGQIINNAINHLNSATAMSGKYVVTMVVSGLRMRHADGLSALTTYTVSVPNSTSTPTLITGSGLQGYITVTNPSATTTTTSTTTSTTSTTTTSTTTTTQLSYLALASDTLNFNDGTTTTPYTMTAFQTSPGITVKWPMANAAAIGFTLNETGTYVPVAGQTLTAAVAITDQTAGSYGQFKAYIDNVRVTRSGSVITITVPNIANALVYGVTRDGNQSALMSYASLVAGYTQTLSTASANSLTVGSAVNNAVTSAGGSFSSMGNLTGTYAVSIVVTDLPLRKADGTLFPTTTITVPTSLAGTTVRTITGTGLTGFITLTP